jgi:formamidopyrimidine-DNA glycosylase
MPELPEVQTIADELRPRLLGRMFTCLKASWAPTLATGPLDQFQARLVGQRILEIGRRGKYLLFSLSDGDALLIHLMMSGRLSVLPSSGPCDRHTHTRFLLDDGHELRLHDVRKLGRVYLVSEAEEIVGHLGPEPLDDGTTFGRFRKLIGQRRGRLKPLLLNQRFLAGLGNIYTDEVLFTARLHPLRTADSLNDREIGRLYRSIQDVLIRALADRGTTLGDAAYCRPDGRTGNHQDRLGVYGRTGQLCHVCGSTVTRIVVGGRGTHLCPRCQEFPVGSDT